MPVDPLGIRRGVVADRGGSLVQQGPGEDEQPEDEDEPQPRAHRDEEPPDPVEEGPDGDPPAAVAAAQVVEGVEALAGRAVEDPDRAVADVLAHDSSLFRR